MTAEPRPEDRAGLASAVATTGLVACAAGAALGLAAGGAPALVLASCASGAASFALALWLARQAKAAWAGRLAFVTVALAAATCLGARGELTDLLLVTLLPLVAALARPLLARREALLAVAVALLLAAVLAARELSDFVTPSGAGALGSSVMLGLIVCGAAFVSWRHSETLARGAAHLRDNELALADANQCLEQEAGRRERLIAELEARNGELERFAYTVSHDLKSPLVTIGGFLGWIRRHAARGDVASLEADLDRIQRARDRMLRLLDDLLQLSRSGRRLSQFENVPFGEVVREVRELSAASLQARQAQLVVCDTLPVVRGDRGGLVQVVQNLLDNALKFSDGPPRVEIGVRREDRRQVLYVRDQGVGIDPAHHARVFGLFERLDAAREGAGVGLAIVKRVVEAHGGRIWVESAGKGAGTTFCFTLPVAQEP
jgi:signal transduction histidine kinase